MVVFCLGNDNILAAYLCPTAGRGMQYSDHEFASVSLKTHRPYLVFSKEVEKTCGIFLKVFFFFNKLLCLENSLSFPGH